jgi:hypothetical protein
MAATLKGHQRYWGDVAVYGDYLPWGVHRAGGGGLSTYPEHSGRILDLKDGKANSSDYFRGRIEPELPDGSSLP